MIEAAGDLYASPRQVFTRVILPLAKPGVVAGCLLVFIPTIGAVCHSRSAWWGKDHDDRKSYSTAVPGCQRLALRVGAVVRIDGGRALGSPVLPEDKRSEKLGMMRNRPWLAAAGLADLLFLYAPIVILIIFSFNDSRLSARWQGFSLQWYAKLFSNEALLSSALNSLIVATVSTTVATVLGVLTALALEGRPFPRPGGL